MHYSFDFWGTLGVPHPEYSKKRLQYLCSISPLSEKRINWEYGRVKRLLDYTTKCNIDSCYQRLIYSLDLRENPRPKFEELFAAYPASIPWDVAVKINDLRSISIGSNTNFISGAMIRKHVFDKIGLKFNFEIFSDEIKYNKPSQQFFQKVKQQTVQEITHIGDSEYFDGGAAKFGIKTIVINKPEDILSIKL